MSIPHLAAQLLFFRLPYILITFSLRFLLFVDMYTKGTPLCIRALFDEIIKRSGYKRGDMTGMWLALAEAIKEHLRAGHRIRLDDLGLLKLEIESDKIDHPEDFKPKQHIRGVRLHFIPESTKGKPDLYKSLEFQEV
jgi:hypothetical protein